MVLDAALDADELASLLPSDETIIKEPMALLPKSKKAALRNGKKNIP